MISQYIVNCYAPKFMDLISFEDERSIFLRFPIKRNDAESETIYFESRRLYCILILNDVCDAFVRDGSVHNSNGGVNNMPLKSNAIPEVLRKLRGL